MKVRFDLMQAQGEVDLHEAKRTPDNKEEEIGIPEQELLAALRSDRKIEMLKAEKEQILDVMHTTKGRVREDVLAAKLNEYERRLKLCDEKTEARKQDLRKELIEQRRQFGAAGVEDLKRKITNLTSQEKQLHTKLRDLETEGRQVGKSSIDVEMMKMEVAALQDISGRLGAELERTRIELQPDSKASGARITRLFDAQPARTVDSKSRWTKIIGGGVAFMILPAVFLIWLDARKERVNSATEIIQGLGLSVIGAVPLIPNRVMRRLNGTSAKQKYWRTLLSESVDSVAAVLHRGAKQGAVRVVMVSSATAGEGKTTLAANLATSLAGAGCRTLLVDFDLRRPALHRAFDLALQPGINDVLRDLNEFDSAIQMTQIPNLAFLAAGRSSTTGLSCLANSDLKSLFERLRSSFEFVVVDGSPILPVVDTRYIAQNVDTVVLSVLRDVSRVPQVRAACKLLESFAIPILGVVVTGSRGDAYPHDNYDLYIDAKAV